MVIDQDTNFLYLADTLPTKQTVFSKRFHEVLSNENIRTNTIPFTKDIWAVDYMPIQIEQEKFIQFTYNPDYLQGSKKWQDSISKVDQIVGNLSINVTKSKIVLDGGNVIKWKDKIILCTKVFKENPSYSEKELIASLEKLFEVDKLIFVPQDPNDEIGHADAMVRFLDGKTVLINDYSKEEKDFDLSFKTALLNAGLSFEILPYNPYSNQTYLQANGTYINYLQMSQATFVPIFNQEEDDLALTTIETLFPNSKIIPVDSSEIAKEGGVLNCITGTF
jgi:agmatine deiminase